MITFTQNPLPGRLVLSAAVALFCGAVSSGQAKAGDSAQESSIGVPSLVTPGDTFSVAVLGFNASDSGSLLTAQLDPAFAGTSTFPDDGLGGQTVTVTSSEAVGATTTTDTFTISVPTNFDPAGTTVGTTPGPVTTMEMDIGGYNAGSDPINFLYGISSPTYAGSLNYSGGTLALSPDANSVLGGGGTTLYSAEGVNAGGSDLAGFAINSFTFSVTYANASVPEPRTWALLSVGAFALVLVRRSRWVARG